MNYKCIICGYLHPSLLQIQQHQCKKGASSNLNTREPLPSTSNTSSTLVGRHTLAVSTGSSSSTILKAIPQQASARRSVCIIMKPATLSQTALKPVESTVTTVAAHSSLTHTAPNAINVQTVKQYPGRKSFLRTSETNSAVPSIHSEKVSGNEGVKPNSDSSSHSLCRTSKPTINEPSAPSSQPKKVSTPVVIDLEETDSSLLSDVDLCAPASTTRATFIPKMLKTAPPGCRVITQVPISSSTLSQCNSSTSNTTAIRGNKDNRVSSMFSQSTIEHQNAGYHTVSARTEIEMRLNPIQFVSQKPTRPQSTTQPKNAASRSSLLLQEHDKKGQARSNEEWPEAATKLLIAMLRENYEEFNTGVKVQYYKLFATSLCENGYHFDHCQVQTKWSKLKQKYSEKIRNMGPKETGRSPKTFKYFEDLHSFLWKRPEFHPIATEDTSSSSCKNHKNVVKPSAQREENDEDDGPPAVKRAKRESKAERSERHFRERQELLQEYVKGTNLAVNKLSEALDFLKK